MRAWWSILIALMLICFRRGLQQAGSQASSTFMEERMVLALKQWNSVSILERVVVIRKSSASKCMDLSKAWKRSVNSLLRWKTMRQTFSCPTRWINSWRRLKKTIVVVC